MGKRNKCSKVVFTQSLLCPECSFVIPPSGGSGAHASRGTVHAPYSEDNHTAVVTNEPRPGEVIKQRNTHGCGVND